MRYLFTLKLPAELLILLLYLLSFDLNVLHHPLPQVNIALVFHRDTFLFIFFIIVLLLIIDILSQEGCI